jgi:hypothetical protein
MQLMPGTAREVIGEADPFDPDNNVRGGITCLARQYRMFTRLIPDDMERLKFSLAAYNCGAGYVLKAIQLFYEEEHGEPLPPEGGYRQPGNWQVWDHASLAMAYKACEVRGHHPDFKQTWNYVKRIFKVWGELTDAENP